MQIHPDQGLMVAVERQCSGANVHKANQVLQRYLDDCFMKRRAEVAKDERELRLVAGLHLVRPGQRKKVK